MNKIKGYKTFILAAVVVAGFTVQQQTGVLSSDQVSSVGTGVGLLIGFFRLITNTPPLQSAPKVYTDPAQPGAPAPSVIGQ